MTDDATARASRDNPPIPVSPRQSPQGLTTLMVDKAGVEIGLTPRATGSHVITLDGADNRAFVVLRAHLVRALNPFESR
jgi:hypothetical protein